MAAEVKQRVVKDKKEEKTDAVNTPKPKYWEPLTDGVKWIEKYAGNLENFFERVPEFVTTFIATLAVFTFGATLREPLELEETAKVDPLSLPLQSLENNLVIVPCDDDIPCTLDQEEFCPQQDLKEKVNSEIGNDKAFDDFQSIEIQDMEVDQTEKENKWSSWKPKALKTKISPYLKSNQKITKVGVTAKLDHLTESRLELVKLQKEIAIKEHEFVKQAHLLKMQNLHNDERRKQEMHEVLLSKLRTGVNYGTSPLEIINKDL